MVSFIGSTIQPSPNTHTPNNIMQWLTSKNSLTGTSYSSAGLASFGTTFKTPTHATPLWQMANTLACPGFSAWSLQSGVRYNCSGKYGTIQSMATHNIRPGGKNFPSHPWNQSPLQTQELQPSMWSKIILSIFHRSPSLLNDIYQPPSLGKPPPPADSWHSLAALNMQRHKVCQPLNSKQSNSTLHQQLGCCH